MANRNVATLAGRSGSVKGARGILRATVGPPNWGAAHLANNVIVSADALAPNRYLSFGMRQGM